MSGGGSGMIASSTAFLADKYGILGSLHKRQTATAGGAPKIDLQTPIDQYLKTLVHSGETVNHFEQLSGEVYINEVNISSSTFIHSIYIENKF